MLNPQSFDEIAARIGKAIENSPAKDIEKNVKAMLASGLARLDLVPRAEFEVQAQVLLKTREKLEALEKRVAEFEARFPPPSGLEGAHRRRDPMPDAMAPATIRRRNRQWRSRSFSRAGSPGSRRRSSPLKCTSPADCPPSISSGCRTPKSRSRAIGCAPRSRTRNSISRRGRSPSILRPPTFPRSRAGTTCP